MEPARKLDRFTHDEKITWAESNLEAWRQAQEAERSKSEEADSVWLVSYADMMTLLVGFFALLMSYSTIEGKKFEAVKKSIAKQYGGHYEVPYSSLAQDIKHVISLDGLERQVDVETDEQGVTLTFRDALFFDVGSSSVKEEALRVLDRVITSIIRNGNNFDLVVEGHTDNTPVRGDQLTNWELSGLRAARVVRRFQESGMDATRLQGVGFGDTRPLVPNQDAQGVPILENQAKNRRVVVKLVRRYTKSVEPTAAGTQDSGK